MSAADAHIAGTSTTHARLSLQEKIAPQPRAPLDVDRRSRQVELQETAVKGVILWLLGIPLPLILLGYCTGVL